MKLNYSSCLFFGCECFGTCTCVCKLLIPLCCQINVFKSFRAKRGGGTSPSRTLPILVTHAHFGSLFFFFFRTLPFPDLATGLQCMRLPHNRKREDNATCGVYCSKTCQGGTKRHGLNTFQANETCVTSGGRVTQLSRVNFIYFCLLAEMSDRLRWELFAGNITSQDIGKITTDKVCAVLVVCADDTGVFF